MKKEKEIILLGEKNFWWKVRVFLCTIIWLVYGAKGTWFEFKHSLIKHKCEWDIKNIQKDQYCTWNPCKHHGCDKINPIKYS